MQKLHFSIVINAPVEKVWDTMLEKETYVQWTEAFNPGAGESYYEGDWSEGSEMRFIGTDEKGNAGGMFSRVKENRLHEFLSIEHIGIIVDGKVDTTSEEVKKWAPAYENYTFHKKDGATEVLVDIDTNDEYAAMFSEMWPKALQDLKSLCEK